MNLSYNSFHLSIFYADDSTNYGIKVSLPPQGHTQVILYIEELLFRKRNEIEFQVPVFPGVAVDLLTLNVSIHEPYTGISSFALGELASTELTTLVQPTLEGDQATVHMEVTNVSRSGYVADRGIDLPRLLDFKYDTGPLPSEGLLIPDETGTCFMHLFNPFDELMGRSGTIPRNIVFVIDISGSMRGQKLEDAKTAFHAIVDTLNEEDTFVLQTFSSNGVEGSVGPLPANGNGKVLAKDWVNRLEAQGSTNINAALMEGVQTLYGMKQDSEIAVPILVILTDGQATAGVTYSVQIAQNVRNINNFVEAKIYGLAFGYDADLSLLIGISIQNGGMATRIFEGYGDAAYQMENFYVGELGSILLYDVNVVFDGIGIDSTTRRQYSVLPGGSEVAIRARVSSLGEGTVLRATTSGTTARGLSSWEAEYDFQSSTFNDSEQSECLHSFAHAKIGELMLFREAVLTLGPDNMADWLVYYGIDTLGIDLYSNSNQGRNGLASNLEQLALDLAIEAGVVWPGLTSLVTVENPELCAAWLSGEVDICPAPTEPLFEESVADVVEGEQSNGESDTSEERPVTHASAMTTAPGSSNGNGGYAGVDQDDNGMPPGSAAMTMTPVSSNGMGGYAGDDHGDETGAWVYPQNANAPEAEEADASTGYFARSSSIRAFPLAGFWWIGSTLLALFLAWK